MPTTTALDDLSNVDGTGKVSGDVLSWDGSSWAASGGYVTGTGGGKETVATNATSGATATLDLANGNVHALTLTANCTLTFTGTTASVACSFTLVVTQDATGSRTVTWPASVNWPGGTAPNLSTAAGAFDVLTFTTIDNGTTWYGFLAGAGMA